MKTLNLLLLFVFCVASYVQAAEQIIVLPTFAMDSTNVNSFVTPVAYWQGDVYTANVEPGNGLGIPEVNLQTVVRKCTLGTEAKYDWQSTVLDGSTLSDMYHTQPSIAVDKNGYIHVAYNMHNMPWQYCVSRQPRIISSFNFLGNAITLLQKSTVKLLNKTPFPSIGSAAIPGNQITYPAFYYDRNQDLYVTYRYATRPKLSFGARSFAGGIAAYNVNTKKWTSLGGKMTITSDEANLPNGAKTAVSMPFAQTDNWQPQPIRLAFDRDNGMHVAWVWREHKGGSEYTNASYAFSDDLGHSFKDAKGLLYRIPLKMSDAERPFATYLSNQKLSMAVVSITPDAAGQPYFVAVPAGYPSLMTYFNKTNNNWEPPEPMPLNATRLEIDDDGRQWVFTTGLKILRREAHQKKWAKVWEDSDPVKYGWPKVLSIPNERLFLIHTINTDVNKVKIYVVKY